MIKRNGFCFILLILTLSLLTVCPLTVGATPECDEGPIKKSEVEDDASVIQQEEPTTFKATTQSGSVKIFLDPGHGGKDPGAQSNGLNEKDVVLDIALKTKEELDNEYDGVETKIYRSTNTLVELEDRKKKAKD